MQKIAQKNQLPRSGLQNEVVNLLERLAGGALRHRHTETPEAHSLAKMSVCHQKRLGFGQVGRTAGVQLQANTRMVSYTCQVNFKHQKRLWTRYNVRT